MGELVTHSGQNDAMRFLLFALLALAGTALTAGCHAHGPGGHSHGTDGGEVTWDEGVREDSAPAKGPRPTGRLTEWWGLFDGKQNVGTRRVTERPLGGGGRELVMETDWFDGNVNDLVRVRGGSGHQADDILVKTYSDGLVKREHAFEREGPGSTVMVVRDTHNADVRRLVVPPDAMLLAQLPNFVEAAYRGEATSVTLVDTEGGIATWSLGTPEPTHIIVHGDRVEATRIDAAGGAIEGHTRAALYVVAGRVELIALGDTPRFVLRASRAGARQDLQDHPLHR